MSKLDDTQKALGLARLRRAKLRLELHEADQCVADLEELQERLEAATVLTDGRIIKGEAVVEQALFGKASR